MAEAIEMGARSIAIGIFSVNSSYSLNAACPTGAGALVLGLSCACKGTLASSPLVGVVEL